MFGLVALAVLFAMVKSLTGGNRPGITQIGLLVLTAGLSFYSVQTWRDVQLDSGRLSALIGDLLHNVYRSFDYRGEEAAYDILAQSVSGDLLADVYLETRNGLVLANQGGAQVKVKDIDLSEARLVSTDGNALTVEARWTVAGSVGHWGHIHQRTNAYHANVIVDDTDGQWKLSGLEILEEERL